MIAMPKELLTTEQREAFLLVIKSDCAVCIRSGDRRLLNCGIWFRENEVQRCRNFEIDMRKYMEWETKRIENKAW